MRRLLNVSRIQLVNLPVVLGLPLLVLGLVLLANLAIFAVINDSARASEPVNGAVVSFYFVLLSVHLQTMTQIFPFAAGLNVTRRTFFGATTLVVLGQSLAYGILLTLLRLVESGTGGWGMGLRFFGLPFLVQHNPLLQLLVYTAPLLLMSFIGVWIGIVFKRWGQPGIYTIVIGAGLLAVAFAFLVTWQQQWASVARFFVEQPSLALLFAYPFALAAVFAGAGYVTIRRAVP
ncbi:hypothetical protein SAMN04487905_103313 [Actinopolyspora xinjiangensis]|uniref:Uncharacterized protein n=1 Tax=Actinopolyspora xinjiangensis TaxID=405564 RepID=A0A1H0S0E4_9ACTN|nr:hypothetical protein [Actinopolyspora xinjiangensis]SDP35097.1 hypothetical protein SAMN04487905_103313 [Actinopolyspora xinjiangensis]